MDAGTLVMTLLVGGILGMVGQGIRAIVGLKKVSDAAKEAGKGMGEEFKPATLVVSLVIGFVAGVLGIVSLDMGDEGVVDKATILTLLGIGYAGTDFIEGFIRKYPAVAQAANAATAVLGDTKK